jgi:hypothetical protein
MALTMTPYCVDKGTSFLNEILQHASPVILLLSYKTYSSSMYHNLTCQTTTFENRHSSQVSHRNDGAGPQGKLNQTIQI